MTLTHMAAGALALFGAAVAAPIALAQLDFAGIVNVFEIHSGGSPRALVVVVGVAGFLTLGVIAVAIAGAGLAATGARSARTVLIAAAIAGFVTAMPLWLPAGVVIAAAALLAGHRQAGPGTERTTGRASCESARTAGLRCNRASADHPPETA